MRKRLRGWWKRERARGEWLEAAFVIACTLYVLVGALGCGGGGGDSSNGPAAQTGDQGGDASTTTLECNLGSNNTFVFNAGDGASIDFCVLNGGEIQNVPDIHPNDQSGQDNSTNNHPDDSSGQTVNNPPPKG